MAQLSCQRHARAKVDVVVKSALVARRSAFKALSSSRTSVSRFHGLISSIAGGLAARLIGWKMDDDPRRAGPSLRSGVGASTAGGALSRQESVHNAAVRNPPSRPSAIYGSLLADKNSILNERAHVFAKYKKRYRSDVCGGPSICWTQGFPVTGSR